MFCTLNSYNTYSTHLCGYPVHGMVFKNHLDFCTNHAVLHTWWYNYATIKCIETCCCCWFQCIIEFFTVSDALWTAIFSCLHCRNRDCIFCLKYCIIHWTVIQYRNRIWSCKKVRIIIKKVWIVIPCFSCFWFFNMQRFHKHASYPQKQMCSCPCIHWETWYFLWMQRLSPYTIEVLLHFKVFWRNFGKSEGFLQKFHQNLLGERRKQDQHGQAWNCWKVFCYGDSRLLLVDEL